MKTKYILNIANVKADDDIDIGTFILYFNEGISLINMEKSYKFPDLDPAQNSGELNEEYEVSDEKYINTAFQKLLSTYIAYYIKKVDGYTDATNPFYFEFYNALNSFDNRYRVKIRKELVQDKEITNNDKTNYVFRLLKGVKFY